MVPALESRPESLVALYLMHVGSSTVALVSLHTLVQRIIVSRILVSDDEK
jgi:hypothetical protein